MNQRLAKEANNGSIGFRAFEFDGVLVGFYVLWQSSTAHLQVP